MRHILPYFHAVGVSAVFLIIVRGCSWLKVDWLLVVVMVATAAPLRPRTTSRWCSLSGLWLRSSNHSLPRFTVLCECPRVSVHLDFVLARFLDVLLTKLLFSSVGQVYPVVWSDELKPRPDLLPTLHSLIDDPTECHS